MPFRRRSAVGTGILWSLSDKVRSCGFWSIHLGEWRSVALDFDLGCRARQTHVAREYIQDTGEADPFFPLGDGLGEKRGQIELVDSPSSFLTGAGTAPRPSRLPCDGLSLSRTRCFRSVRASVLSNTVALRL